MMEEFKEWGYDFQQKIENHMKNIYKQHEAELLTK